MSRPTAKCGECGRVVDVTTRGRLFVHTGRPIPGLRPDTFRYTTCPGSKRRPAPETSGPYYILSLKWTRKGDPYVCWWRPDDKGYVWALSHAGKYTEERVRANLYYYNSGVAALAVPRAVVDAMATPMDPADSDFGDAPAVRLNTRNMRRLRAAAPLPLQWPPAQSSALATAGDA